MPGRGREPPVVGVNDPGRGESPAELRYFMSPRNVTGDQFRLYLETFHTTLRDKANTYIPQQYRSRLQHSRSMPCRVVGYVSAQFGVAIDYDPFESRTPGQSSIIDVVVGSKRIEELVFPTAPTEFLRMPCPMVFEGHRIWCTGIEFVGPFQMVGEDSYVVFDRCLFSTGQAGEWYHGTAMLEVYGNRRAGNWTADKAVSRATEEVLAGLHTLREAEKKGISLAEYLSTYRDRLVLVLGSYSPGGEKRLRSIAGALKDMGYEALLVSDLPGLPAQTLAQKVVTLGSLARFVIMDDAEKSGHLMELELCKANNWITVILRPDAVASSAMGLGVSVLSKVILETTYPAGMPNDALPGAINWAERIFKEVGAELKKIYPWGPESLL